MSVPSASTRQATTTGRTEPGVAVTCARDGRSHVVPHAVLAESLASGSGQCSALCGHIVLPASLASPPGERCILCAEASGVTRRPPRRRLWR
ncbi:hypothetical protein H7X46_28295 [Pseudonocardia sp. C8]|uniref:hypothetical protein n=1 Tax=Pseudonocardia sp. C8 TaxID=2762759 RepID=UPI0016432B59|nr:hypothetical protein [Pseudonocardia sp. C8]MBC3194959.1 hypothetical protein [Pseudonocardia sp. C8]